MVQQPTVPLLNVKLEVRIGRNVSPATLPKLCPQNVLLETPTSGSSCITRRELCPGRKVFWVRATASQNKSVMVTKQMPFRITDRSEPVSIVIVI